MMTEKQCNDGSFGQLRGSSLRLFDRAVHRHDRGWRHPPPEPGEKRDSKLRWKTSGIFHFRHDEEDEQES